MNVDRPALSEEFCGVIREMSGEKRQTLMGV